MSPAREHMDLRLREKVAAALRMRRAELGITANAMAVLMDVDPAGLRNVLQGKRTAGLDLFVKCRTVLHLSLDAIVDLPAHPDYLEPDPMRGEP